MNKHVFRTNSIRGIYGRDIDENLFRQIAHAFAAYTQARELVVGSDHRLSSPGLKQAFIQGLIVSGCRVRDIGVAPKGLAIYAAAKHHCDLAYISASHLPKEWNGLKFLVCFRHR